MAQMLRDDEALRFELCSGVSGVHYPDDTGRELHAVYHLTSMTHNRRIRVEVTAPDSDPHVPSLVSIYPTLDWHERETYDMFGLIFDGHPALTRVLMPDDWPGHPQRKDYPLGGIPVEYKGGSIPPPDQRRIVQLMTDTSQSRTSTPRPARPARAASSPSRARTGTRSPRASASPPRSGSWSTWARSTRRPTACSGSSSSSRARRSPRPAAASATCTPASRRTWSTAPGCRARRSAPGWTTSPRSTTRRPTPWASSGCSTSRTTSRRRRRSCACS